MRKSLMNIYSRYSKRDIIFVMNSCCEKVFAHMSIWMAGKESMKRKYKQRRNFISTLQWRTPHTLTTNIPNVFVNNLNYKREANFTPCMYRVIPCCLLTYSKVSETSVLKFMK